MNEPVISLSTRVSPEVMMILDAAVANRGCTQRAAIEYAIKAAYGPQDADREIRNALSNAADLITKAHEAVLAAWDRTEPNE